MNTLLNARFNARSRTAVAVLATLGTLTALGLGACSDSRDPVSPPSQGLRPGATPSHLVRASTPTIYMLSFEVQSTTLPSPFLYDIPLTNGGTNASLTMPVGKAYSITVRAYDRYGNQTHVAGLSLASVVEGANPGVELSLKPVTDGVPVATIDVGIVGESRLATGGRIVVKGPSSVNQGDNVAFAAEVIGPDGAVIPLEVGDLHWAVSDPSGGTATPDPVQPRILHFNPNQVSTVTVSVLYHNYQSLINLAVLANNFVEISAASNYTCGIRFLGTLYCWGENSPNQLLGASDATLRSSGVGFTCKGDANQTCVTEPLQIAPGHLFTRVATGATGACAIEKGTGAAWCWGNNSDGLLGVSTSAGELVPPTPIASPIQFQQIAAGGTHFCGISSGLAYCWGDNTNGEIGNGTALGSFGQVGGLTTPYELPGTGWTQISAGNGYTCGIQNSVAKCWGGLNDIYVNGAGVAHNWSPAVVTASWGSATPSSLSVAGGDAQTMCAVIPGGSVGAGAWCWGHDVGDPNGSNPPLGEAYIPYEMPGGSGLTQVANGWHQGCGLDGSGNALCWGSNLYGATGVRNSYYTSTVTAVNAGTLQFTRIASGDDHVCAVTNTGGVYCWGSNEYGQFGDNDQQLVGIPTPTVVWGSNH